MTTRRFSSIGALSLTLALVAGTSFAFPQPEPQPDSPPKADRPTAGKGKAEGREPIDGERLKARLERRLQEFRKLTAELEAGIKRLDEGTPPAEVASDMEALAQPYRSFDGGGPRDRSNGDSNFRGGPDRGPNGERGGWDRGGRDQETPIDPQTVLDVLKDAAPAFATRVEKLRETDPEAADRMIGRMAPRLRDAIQVRNKDPQLFTLRINEIKVGIDLLDAARAYREAVKGGDTAAIDASKAVVADIAAKQFDARLATQEREMHALEERVEGIRGELAKKRSDREKSVEGFVEWILKPREYSGDREKDRDRPSPTPPQ